MLNKKVPSIYDALTDKEKDRESSVMDLSSMKSDSKFHVSEKKGFKELPKKIEVDNNINNISSKEKLKEENNGNENIKSDKRNKELKHELSSLFPKADDNDTVIDVEIKNENDNDVKINIQEKKEN